MVSFELKCMLSVCLISTYAVEIPDVFRTSKLNWLYQISSIDTGELGDDHKLKQQPKSQHPYLLTSLIQKPKHSLHIYVLPVYIALTITPISTSFVRVYVTLKV